MCFRNATLTTSRPRRQTARLRKRSRGVLTLVLLLLQLPAWSSDWVMPGLSAQWIARDMTLNGVPASMRALSGNVRLHDVLRFYRSAWRGALDERVEGDWHVLASRQRDRFVSVRLRSIGHGVEGVLTVSLDPGRATPSLESSILVPPGLVRLAHQAFRDGGERGENLTLMSSRSVAYERQAFVSAYRGEGWTLIEDRAAGSVSEGHIVQFAQGKQSLRVVIYRDPSLAEGQTLVLISAHSS